MELESEKRDRGRGVLCLRWRGGRQYRGFDVGCVLPACIAQLAASLADSASASWVAQRLWCAALWRAMYDRVSHGSCFPRS